MANKFVQLDDAPGQHGALVTDDAPPNLGGTAEPGVSEQAARADHVHQRPTPADIGAATPSYVDDGDAATLASAGTYTDEQFALLAGGVSAKPNIQAATTSAIPSLASVTLASHFSGYTPVAGDRVLVKDQSSASQNGWYLVGTVTGGAAPLTRVSDANASSEFYGVTTCLIARGSLAGKQYKTAQAMTFVLGTDAITFTEIPATPLSSATPQAPGTATAGTSTSASRDDHVHPKEDPTTTRGDLIRRGASALERVALGAAGTTWRSDGTDAVWAEPDLVCTVAQLATTYAPSAALRGVVAYTTDEGATYLCRRTAASTYAWMRLGVGTSAGTPSAYMGPFTGSAYLGGDTGAVAPALSKGQAIVFQFYKVGPLAGATGIIAAHLDGSVTAGWDFGYSSGGNLFLFLKGINSDATMGLGTWNSLSNGLHGVAINFVDDGGATGHLQWALDGVAQSNVTANGTYTAPTTSVPLVFGRHPAGNLPALLADLAACRAYSTALSSGDLLTASTPAMAIPALTGTVSFDLECARDFWPGYATARTGAGSQIWDLTVNGGLTRRVH